MTAPGRSRGTRARQAALGAASSAALRTGPWRRDRSHWYFVSALFVIVAALAAMALVAPAVLVWHRLWPVLVLTPVVVVMVLLARGTELRISAQGVEVRGARFRWDTLELVETRLGTALRTVPGYRGSRSLTVYLWMYGRKWRSGPIGHDLQDWAPELLHDAGFGG